MYYPVVHSVRLILFEHDTQKHILNLGWFGGMTVGHQTHKMQWL